MSKVRIILFACTLVFVSASQVFAGDREGREHLIRRFEDLRVRRMPRNGIIEANVRSSAIDQIRRSKSKVNSPEVLVEQPQWTLFGPPSTAGRVKSIVCHPTIPGLVFVGAASGGVWKSTNRGDDWRPVMDDANAIAMGTLCFDPENPSILYAGTGEQVRGATTYLGAGILRSTDLGNTWHVLGLSTVGSFSRVLINPGSPSTIMASAMNASEGVWKSSDKGLTWNRIYKGQVFDMSMNPNDPLEWFIAVEDSGIMSTSDGGTTWARRMNGLLGNVGRASVQHAPSAPSTLYALIELSGQAVIARSTNSGALWTRTFQDPTACFFSGSCEVEQSQGFYDNVIAVSPKNSNHVIAGGIDLWVSTTGGAQWINTTNGYADGNGNNNVHVDQHSIAFDPLDTNAVYAGNDGGMVLSFDKGLSWSVRNSNLAISQFYGFDADRVSRNRLFGGTQDNGTLGTSSRTEWDTLVNGDGMNVRIDPEATNTIIASGPRGELVRVNMTTKFTERIQSGIDFSEQAEWVVPLVYDRFLPSTVYTGRRRVYRSDNNGTFWSPISPAMYGNVTALAQSPIEAEVLWAGGSFGDLVVSRDFSNKWSVALRQPLPTAYVSSIACSYSNLATAYVAYSTYGVEHLWKTTDYGASWNSAWNTMPDVPVNAIAVHPDDDNIVFAATDIGIFATFNSGTSWIEYGKGLPRSPALALSVDLPFGLLRVATHGRGIWEAPLVSTRPSPPSIITPVGGEAVPGARETWLSWSGFAGRVNVEYSTNDGGTWRSIDTAVSASGMKWLVPYAPCPAARIRVTSSTNASVVAISRSFPITRLKPGTVLGSKGVAWTAYGLTLDGKDGLWTTSIHEPRLYKLNRNTLLVEKVVELRGAGDSLFTDITFSSDQGVFYIHRLDDVNGTSSSIIVVDTNGTLIRTFPSAARSYATGLTLHNNILYGIERNGSRKIVGMNPLNGIELFSAAQPFQEINGPRCLAVSPIGRLLLVCTLYDNNTGKLTNAFVGAINPQALTQFSNRMDLAYAKGYLNARGIEVDPRDGTYWVSDIDGVIWKITGMEFQEPPIVSVEEKLLMSNTIRIAPHPAHGVATIVLAGSEESRQVGIVISDITGRNVLDLGARNQGMGESETFVLNAGSIPSGCYVALVMVNGVVVERRSFVVTANSF